MSDILGTRLSLGTLQREILDYANELANQKNRDFSKDQICRIIKKRYSQEILEKRVTKRWIEESLPREYKRKYKS